MAFEGQVQTALERLDEALAKLRTLIKRGEQQAALHFMEEGELKDRYEELQNMINISGVNPLGARGAQNTGRL